jgi:hypothetical protein
MADAAHEPARKSSVPREARFAPLAVARADLVAAVARVGDPIQRKASIDAGRAALAARPNRTGLPDGLKQGVEAMSGIGMDDVKVHYGSSRPAALQAHAFAEGSDIHIAPGEERHLAHEAWHVVQQKQGRVMASGQVGGRQINDDAGLEREADAMGARAMSAETGAALRAPVQRAAAPVASVLQRAPTEAEKQKLQARVGAAYPNYQFRTVDGVEYASNAGQEFRLIRFKTGASQWRKVPRQHIGGKSFYGRLGDNPVTMAQSGAMAADKQMWGNAPDSGAPAKAFVPKFAIGARENNNKVMGEYFLDGLAPLSASTYAQSQHYEWLHMQGHGLGGGETEDNLYAGSHAANSHMAAIETAAQKLPVSVRPSITLTCQPIVDAAYHSDAVCTAIANDLGKAPDEVIQLMRGTSSRMLHYLFFTVSVNGKEVLHEGVNAQEPGAFDAAWFEKLQKVASTVMSGNQQSIAFVPASDTASGAAAKPGAFNSDAKIDT